MNEIQPQQPFEQQSGTGSDATRPLTTADLVNKPGEVEGAPKGEVPHLSQALFEKHTQQLEQTTCASITSGGESAYQNFHARLWHASKDAIDSNDLPRIERLAQISDKHVDDARGHIDVLSAKLQSTLVALESHDTLPKE